MARFLLLLIFVGLFAVGIADYCAPGWTLFEGNCYRWYGSPRLSWDAAEDYCQHAAPYDCVKWGLVYCSPNLVSIFSDIETEFVSDFWKTSREPVDPSLGQHFWIGLSEYISFNQWSNGQGVAFRNWDRYEPTYGLEGPYCGVMWKGIDNQDEGKWDDQPCYLEKPFMCKYQAMR